MGLCQPEKVRQVVYAEELSQPDRTTVGFEMKRRRFGGLALGAVALPHCVLAQPKSVTIGMLAVDAPGQQTFRDLFLQSMRDLGYEEGKSVHYEFRTDAGQLDRLPALAAELASLKVDVIVTWFTPAVIAAKQATTDIPIVMAQAGDPISTGVVASLSRPGGNVTGIAGGGANIGGKALQYMHELVPKARRVIALVNAPDPFSVPFRSGMQAAAAARTLEFEPVLLNRKDDADAVLSAHAGASDKIFVVQPSLASPRLAQQALKFRVPIGATQRAFVNAGALMSYWWLESAMYRRTAEIVDKLLKGARPGETPVEHPTRLELVINLRTAKELGITVAPSLLSHSDAVIE